MSEGFSIALRPWTEHDRYVLDRTVGDAHMMTHLGGPEMPGALDARHARYVALAKRGAACMNVILIARETVAGSAGFWESEWRGELVYEAGWMVFPEFARRGVATAAASRLVALARNDGRHRFVHAFPSVDNAASNGVCRNAGFELLGPCDVEYPIGHTMRANDWRFDLAAGSGGR